MRSEATRDLDARVVQVAGDGIREILAIGAAIAQHTFDSAQSGPAAFDRPQDTLAVIGIGSGHPNGVRQALGVHGDMAFDASDLLAAVIAVGPRVFGVRYALGIDDDKTGGFLAALGLPVFSDLIFLKRCPEDSRRWRRVAAIGTTRSTPSATSENRPVACAIGNRWLAHITQHRTPRRDRPCGAGFSYADRPGRAGHARTVHG